LTLGSTVKFKLEKTLRGIIGGGSGGVPIVFEPYNVWVVTAVDSTGRVTAERIIGEVAPGPSTDTNGDNLDVIVTLPPGNYTVGKDLSTTVATPGDIFFATVSGNRQPEGGPVTKVSILIAQ
jgi:hypothetical protein